MKEFYAGQPVFSGDLHDCNYGALVPLHGKKLDIFYDVCIYLWTIFAKNICPRYQHVVFKVWYIILHSYFGVFPEICSFFI